MRTQTSQKAELFACAPMKLLLGVFAIFLCAVIFFSSTIHSAAATQSTINFQARLENTSGSIAADGNYNIEFKLYNASTGGTALWTETYQNSNSQGIQVINGYVTVNLGAISSFPSTINWDQDLYLTMNIGGTSTSATPTYDGEMTPRLKLTAVPYAFRAGQLAKLSGANTSTLDFASQTGARSILLPDESGTLCIQNSTNCGFLTGAAASGSYVQLQGASPGTAQTGNFNITGTGIAALLQAANINATSAFKLNGTSGSTTTCTSGDVLQNAVIQGGIVTGGTCIANGGGAIASLTLAGTSGTNQTITNGDTITLAAGTNITTTGGATDTVTIAVVNAPSFSGVITSTVATGTAPLVVASTTKVTNLNSDTLDGIDSTGFAPSSGSANYIQNQNASAQTTSNFWISGTGKANLLNSVTGYQFNGTAGATTTCSSGDFLQNAVIQGGIITGGTCAAGGASSGFVTLQGSTPGTADTGNFNVSGTGIAAVFKANDFDRASAGTLTFGATNATAITIGKTTSNTQTTVNGTALFKPTSGNDSTTAFKIQSAGGTNLLNVDTTNFAVGVGTTPTRIGSVYIGNTKNSGAGGWIQFQKFTTGSAGTLNSISVYIGAAGTAPNNKYKVAIYSNQTGTNCGNAGAVTMTDCPNALVASTGDNTVNAWSWNTATISASLAGGTKYWMAITQNGVGADDNTTYFDASGTDYYLGYNTTYGAWPASFSPGGTLTGMYGSNVVLSMSAAIATTSDSYGIVTNNIGNLGVGMAASSLTKLSIKGLDGGIASALNVQGTQLIQTNGSHAFEVQDITGTNSLFSVDALNHRTYINGSAVGSYTRNAALTLGPSGSDDIMTLLTNTGAQALYVDGSGNIGFGGSTNKTISVDAPGSAGAGVNLSVKAATANGAFAGGTLNLQGGAASATAGSNGGAVAIAGASGSATGTGGAGGGVTVSGGNAGGSGNNNGGNILLSAGSATGTGTAGSVTIKNASDSTRAFVVQNAAGSDILTVNASGGTIVLGKASTLDGALVFSNATNNNTVGLITGVTSASYNIQLPSAIGTAGQCLYLASVSSPTQTIGYTSCGGTGSAGVTLQGSTPGTADVGNFNVTGTGIADILQGTTKVVTSLVDTVSSGALNIGTTNATQINLNKNVVVASGQYISLVGGITSTRPASPTEGMLYYDTTIKALLVYANGKWQSYAGNTATKIVAMGATTGCTGSSPVASVASDGADYVSTSCTSSQTTINSAITSLPSAGGTVYLMEGTYIIDGSILMGNNTRLVGSGPGTVIKLKDGINASINAISNNTTSAGMVLDSLMLDGNKANNSSGTQHGFYILNGGSATQHSVEISNVTIKNFRNNGLDFWQNNYTTVVNSNFMSNDIGVNMSISNNNAVISNSQFVSNTTRGLSLGSSGNLATGNTLASNGVGIYVGGSNNQVTGNLVRASTGNGIAINNSTTQNNVSGNQVYSNGGAGISIGINSAYNTVTSNSINSNTGIGISTSTGSNNNAISGNKLYDNASTGASSSIDIDGTSNQVSNNQINDTAGTGFAIRVASGAVNTLLSNNTYAGTGAASISDNSTSTIYTNQFDSNGNIINRNQGGLTVGKTSASYTLDVQGSMRTTTLTTPSAPSLARTGTNNAITYGYKISALDGFGETLASTETTNASGPTTLNGSNYFTITWAPVGGAVQYKVYRTTSGGTPATTGLIGTVAGNVLTFNDTGIAASGSTPASNTTGAGVFAGALQGGSLDNSAAAALSIGATNATSISLGKTSSNIQTTINGTALFKPTSGNDSTTAVQIQKADSTVLFTADTQNMQVIIGTAGNTITLSSNGIVLAGNARNSKVITLTAEYIGAVLDAGTGSNNSGTMTSGIDLTNRMNYYKWTTTQATNQSYDIDVQVPIPSDFSAWASVNPISINTYTSNTTNGTITLEARNSSGTVETSCNFVSVTPGSTTTWTASTACTLASVTTGYTAGGYMTLRIRLQSPTSGDVRVGNIVLSYLSKY